MKNIIILLAMLLCLFGPTAVFTMIGYRSMTELGKRPSQSARIMISFFSKLLIATVIVFVIVTVLLKVFAPK